MKILTSIEKAPNVRKALEKAVKRLNDILRETPGRIARMDVSVDVGVTGATSRIIVAIDEKYFAYKYLVWANEPGRDENTAIRNAQSKINAQIKEGKGDIAGFYSKLISPPLLARTYSTIIVGINEDIKEKRNLSREERRELLSSAVHLLGGDPKVINIAHLSKILGISRDTLYEDLRRLGFKR